MRELHDQFIHLVRLAWDLRDLGVASVVRVPRDGEPSVEVLAPLGLVRVRAGRRGRTWVFTWGRSHARQVRAMAEDASERIAQVAR